MCNFCSHTTGQEAIRRPFAIDRDLTGNLPPQPGIYPDFAAPVVYVREAERTLSTIRCGMPSSGKVLYDATAKRAGKLRDKGKPVDFDVLLRLESDGGTTNIRNTASPHWKMVARPRKPVPDADDQLLRTRSRR